MKRLSLLFGFALLSLRAFPALAAGDDFADLEPVSSHYIERVVNRARDGLSFANEGNSSAITDILRLFWVDQLAADVFALVDTNMRIVEQSKDLLENSPCLRIDALILEGWIERVRMEGNQAAEAGDALKMYRLGSLLGYLNNRLHALLDGARDPQYVDEEEGNIYDFDPPPYWCCDGTSEETDRGGTCSTVDDPNTCLAGRGGVFKRLSSCVAAGCTENGDIGDEGDPICPFDSDYLPPTSWGYGCDLSVLSKYQSKGHEATRKEYEALSELVQSRDEFIESMAPLKEITEFLNAHLNVPVSNLANFQGGLSSSVQHRTITGCLREGEDWPEGLIAWERRGPFSLHRNEVSLMPKFFDLWRNWGARRVMPNYLKSSDEFPDNAPEKASVEEDEKGVFGWVYLKARADARKFMKDFSTEQEGNESMMIAKSLDAPLRIMEVLSPIRSEVSAFVDTVKKPDEGIRGFVRNYAFFLRVSCIFRPCSEQLDRILKIVFQDSCFPYASGLFLEDSKVDETCRNDASL